MWQIEKKQERSSKDEGRNDNKTRFKKPLISRFPKDVTFAKADNGNAIQGNELVATKASQGREALKRPYVISTSIRPEVQPFLLPLTAKDESPWEIYDKEYAIELGGLVIVSERKHHAYGLVVVKEFSGHDAENKLSRLRQIPEDIRNSYFVSCIEVFYLSILARNKLQRSLAR